MSLQDKVVQIEASSEPVHEMFGLTYAPYLVIPRSVLQSAPIEWQRRFVTCLAELEDMFGPAPCGYRVSAMKIGGAFVEDPLHDYERGRRRVPYCDGYERVEQQVAELPAHKQRHVCSADCPCKD